MGTTGKDAFARPPNGSATQLRPPPPTTALGALVLQHQPAAPSRASKPSKPMNINFRPVPDIEGLFKDWRRKANAARQDKAGQEKGPGRARAGKDTGLRGWQAKPHCTRRK